MGDFIFVFPIEFTNISKPVTTLPTLTRDSPQVELHTEEYLSARNV